MKKFHHDENFEYCDINSGYRVVVYTTAGAGGEGFSLH